MDRVAATIAFLKDSFDESEYLSAHDYQKTYRLEHTLRVANIGRRIALAEGLDADAATVACLLHDISYRDCPEEMPGGSMEHGRIAARIARPFVESLGFPGDTAAQMLYGIAIHVDDKVDFEGECTPLALTVGDADNIDRFDAYRIYENLEYKGYSGMSFEERRTFCRGAIERLTKYETMSFGTPTATAMWLDKLCFQKEFIGKLDRQLDNSLEIVE